MRKRGNKSLGNIVRCRERGRIGMREEEGERRKEKEEEEGGEDEGRQAEAGSRGGL